MSLSRKFAIPVALRSARLLAIAAVALLLAAESSLAADAPELHDDGVVEPYVPRKEHLDYIATLDPGLVPTLKADPAMIEQWQDDRFGVFMHWDPSCQMTGAVSWSRKGRRPHHPSDGTVS